MSFEKNEVRYEISTFWNKKRNIPSITVHFDKYIINQIDIQLSFSRSKYLENV